MSDALKHIKKHYLDALRYTMASQQPASPPKPTGLMAGLPVPSPHPASQRQVVKVDFTTMNPGTHGILHYGPTTNEAMKVVFDRYNINSDVVNFTLIENFISRDGTLYIVGCNIIVPHLDFYHGVIDFLPTPILIPNNHYGSIVDKAECRSPKWKLYTGFTDTFEYCEICDKKKGEHL